MTESDEHVINGRYRIESLIGRGGMADVYRGHDLSLERSVAVKMLRPDLARDPQFQTRFRREAQSSASLNHPNIVGVYDTGAAPVDGTEGVRAPYIVMEHVDGVTLRHILHGSPDSEAEKSLPPPPPDDELAEHHGHVSTSSQESTAVVSPGSDASPNVLGVEDSGQQPTQPISAPLQQKIDHALNKPLDETEAAGYMRGILGALGYSHQRGIVHRDIKPSNVMVSNAGDVKVMDFGIARAVADSAQTMTQTSAVVGTAQYLSPEQARGEVVDQRSDLYSAGCVLFELLTNRPPFTGDSPVSVAYQHVREDPPAVSDFNHRVTPAMESVVAKALTKSPADRFQTAEEFADAVNNALQGISVEDYQATTVVPALAGAVAGPGGNSFDDLVGTKPPLSATTPEDPDIDDYYADYREDTRRRRRGLLLPILGVLMVLAFIIAGIYILTQLNTEPEVVDVEIPLVEGFEESVAVDTLTAEGLNPQVETQVHDEIDEGHAIGTDPGAGQIVEENSEIILFISEGSDVAEIPEGLVGSDLDDAVAQIEELGLELGTVTEEDGTDANANEVLSHTPEAGEEVPLGSTVDFTVSSGETQLPSGLIGTWWQNAGDRLEEVGFTYEVDWFLDDECEDNGDCYDVLDMSFNGQNLEPGSSLPYGSHIVLRSPYPPEPEEEEDEDEDEDDDSEDDDSEDDDSEDEDSGNDEEDDSEEEDSNDDDADDSDEDN